jgi:hypothetical protein
MTPTIAEVAPRWTLVSNGGPRVAYIFDYVPQGELFAIHYGMARSLHFDHDYSGGGGAIFYSSGVCITVTGRLTAHATATELVAEQRPLHKTKGSRGLCREPTSS